MRNKLGLCIALGAVIGLALDQLAIGVVLGVVIGVAIGRRHDQAATTRKI